MSILEMRGRGFEGLFVLDEALRFKMLTRRNRLGGQWVAQKLGLKGEAAESYAKNLADFMARPNGQRETFRKVAADLGAAGYCMTPNEARAEFRRFEAEAKSQLKRD